MRTSPRVLQVLASGLLILLALGGGLFAAGYAISDLPLLPVILGISIWALAAAGLGWLALRRTGVAVPTLLAVSVAVAALAVIDGRFDLFNRNTNGPVMTLIILAVVVPVALLGCAGPPKRGSCSCSSASRNCSAPASCTAEARERCGVPPWAGPPGSLCCPSCSRRCCCCSPAGWTTSG